ncbi:cytosine-specific methyltransferase [Youhaiella tibetensis]|uniref:Cytosine-specific methyltransferase n=1 Tax=Paradevosia tibetensis TaxID=1447062 RepID=A0A5B9DJW1_9HYPH|nr:DNA cytosine methyltransferase [Youhaiella tibetensis]QEE19417.1 DNA cytosine methyltransferase [Youhaiella tibetensis]GGF33384.1 cytosine-specific methyltransferase [Youhaiella tibetensis]
MRPIAIDLFAGAGGMSLGFEQAGFDVVAAVEIDPIHASTHQFNFPETATLARSVIGLSGQEIRQQANIGDADVDVVFGGAPCQGFSLIGQRQLDDPRNRLVKEFVRIVVELGAKHAVFENVKGLTVGQHKRLLEELIQEFRANGYSVTLPWKVLNAKHFGVPQSRERLFLLASRSDQPGVSYPDAGTSKAVNCHEALGDLPDAELFPELQETDHISRAPYGTPSSYAEELRALSNEAWHYGYTREWTPGALTSSLRTEHTAESRARFAAASGGSVEPVSRFFKLDALGVSNTLRAGTDSARGAFTSPRPIHYAFNRCVTVREMMRLHGYPDWFRMHKTKWHGARQVGNSVPPPLARAVASEVLRALGMSPTRPSGAIKLGDEAWLSFDMGQASSHFGIAIPIAQRRRSSETFAIPAE